jgi:alginate O-acetyltransferase complex protein AlgI
MTFLSPSYLLFVPAVWILARLVRSSGQRQVLMLVASYAFYGSLGLNFLAVLLVSSAVNHLWGRVMRRAPTTRNLWIGIGFNLLVLALFKYVPSTGIGSGSLLGAIAMPVGVSFWTFQALSYQIDLYREEDIDPSAVEFFLYMALWPTVLSGPVCRLPEMLGQFRQLRRPTWDDLAAGAPRIITGLFLKLVAAQLLAGGLALGDGLDAGFDQITGWSGLDVWALAFAFGFQLFFDFAGYSHMAIGVARLFGLELRENFDRPYLSTTPSVFWTRWHMSLSSWIRDYVFMSLAPMHRSNWWRQFVLGMSMVLFGLWHDAALPFLIWGAYHGALLVLHRQVQSAKRALAFEPPGWLETPISWAVTLVLICFGWIFFRAHDVRQIGEMVSAVLNPWSYGRTVLRPNFYIVSGVTIAAYFAIELIRSGLRKLESRPVAGRIVWLLSPIYYSALILLIVTWSRQEGSFVYFAF